MRIAGFRGTVADFRLYLLAMRLFLENEKGHPAATGKAHMKH